MHSTAYRSCNLPGSTPTIRSEAVFTAAVQTQHGLQSTPLSAYHQIDKVVSNAQCRDWCCLRIVLHTHVITALAVNAELAQQVDCLMCQPRRQSARTAALAQWVVRSCTSELLHAAKHLHLPSVPVTIS